MCLCTVLLKDEELARDLEYGKKQLLLTAVNQLRFDKVTTMSLVA